MPVKCLQYSSHNTFFANAAFVPCCLSPLVRPNRYRFPGLSHKRLPIKHSISYTDVILGALKSLTFQNIAIGFEDPHDAIDIERVIAVRMEFLVNIFDAAHAFWRDSIPLYSIRAGAGNFLGYSFLMSSTLLGYRR